MTDVMPAPTPSDDQPPTESASEVAREAPEAPEVPRAIRHVPFSDLYLEYKFWANPRSQTGLDDVSIRDLAASILAGTTSSGESEDASALWAGVRVPLEVVMIRANGGVVNLVIDGQRRYRGVEAAKLPPDAMIPVFDLEPSPVEWTREKADEYLLRALEAVGTRAGLSSFELSESANRLRGSKDPETTKPYTLAKISRAIGRSESWVSRILAARESATPKLLHRWKTGEMTDEQFKDLSSVRDPAQQRADADAVVRARQSGDKAGARILAKEQKIIAKAAAPARPSPPTKAAETRPPLAGGRPLSPPPARKPPSFAVVEDFLGLSTKKPPTHDYVKGLMDGARWAVGLMDPSKFGKAWHSYMSHVIGAGAGPLSPDKRTKGKKKRK